MFTLKSVNFHPNDIKQSFYLTSGNSITILNNKSNRSINDNINDGTKNTPLNSKKILDIVESNVVLKNPPIDEIWAGSYNSFARTSDGSIFAWGLNNCHQLGCVYSYEHACFSDSDSRYFPSKWIVKTDSKTFQVRQISSSINHTLVLDRDGLVYTAGRNTYGQLGVGKEVEESNKFRLVSALKRLYCTHVCAGLSVSFAVTEDGKLFKWGQRSSQLGCDDDGNDDDDDGANDADVGVVEVVSDIFLPELVPCPKLE
ncbi:hypothetical protein HELRODRAFT_171575 [Helobdella robusta]|uniref:Uncharacterized protein n=1 Tax=Helobdella robusta TaxID=6412 RepID=T1F4F0_HELRO|nr:hypothetical protein HELRODRAFT_171575 [Helobdella robusta]ESO05222.1 hypothetical protein HELRODRAFT_171575 [Helobdella robusta]